MLPKNDCSCNRSWAASPQGGSYRNSAGERKLPLLFSVVRIARNTSTTKCRRKIGQYQGEIAVKFQIREHQTNLSDENGQKETRVQDDLDSSNSGEAEPLSILLGHSYVGNQLGNYENLLIGETYTNLRKLPLCQCEVRNPLSVIFIMTMANDTNFRKDIIASVKATYGNYLPIMQAVIPDTVRLAEISTADHSIFKHEPKGKAADAYRTHVQEVMDIGEKQRSRSVNVTR